MKIKGSKIGTIIASTGVVIFTLAAAFSGSIAWFQANRTQVANSGEFNVYNVGNNVSSISFHQFTGAIENNEIDYFSFNPIPTGRFVVNENGEMVEVKENESDPDFVMSMNDFTLDNPHQPILILIELTTTGSAYITANINSNVSVYPTTNNSLKGRTQGDNPLSSVTEFYSFAYSSTSSDPTSLASRTINGSYVVPTSECITGGSNWNSFVTINQNGDYKGYGSEVVLYNGSTQGMSYVGIVVDYYYASLEWISSYYLGDSRLDDKLTFKCDWWMCLC